VLRDLGGECECGSWLVGVDAGFKRAGSGVERANGGTSDRATVVIRTGLTGARVLHAHAANDGHGDSGDRAAEGEYADDICGTTIW
jgi:hypothetical protein